jgi:hypothetical protein
MIIVKLPKYLKFYSDKNMGYYLSSGLSNDRFNGLYANTWVPTGGITEISTEERKQYHIVKMSDFFFKISTNYLLDTYLWIYNILRDYYTEFYITDNQELKKFISFIFENDTPLPRLITAKIQPYINNDYKIIDSTDFLSFITDVENLYRFIYSYFLFDWQLYISCILSNNEQSYWERNPMFKKFILRKFDYMKNDIRTIILPSYDVWTENKRHVEHLQANDKDVQNFFINNNAFYNPEDSDLIKSLKENDMLKITTFSSNLQLIRGVVERKNRMLNYKPNTNFYT